MGGAAAAAAHGAATWHVWGGKLMGATMWFWVFHRLREDGDVLLVSEQAEEHARERAKRSEPPLRSQSKRAVCDQQRARQGERRLWVVEEE